MSSQVEDVNSLGTPSDASSSINSIDTDVEKLKSDELVFDLEVVLNEFKKCRGNDGQVLLAPYLSGYSEVNKFFQILGNVFNFVASDVSQKINILQCFRNGGGGEYYYSIQSMIEYEKELGTIDSPSMVSGSRHLLRLNRALEFITGFLEELRKASDDAKLNSASARVYNETLAKYHSWVVVKTVKVALYLMPNKKVIVDKVTKGDNDRRKRNEDLLPEVVEVMKSVYSLVQKLYEDYNIMNLP